MRHRTSAWWLPIALLTIGGCGGGASGQAAETTPAEEAPPRATGPVHARGENEVRARVGSAGGTLELANGGRLEIPAGALGEEVEIVFTTGASAREAWDAETKRPLGPTLEVRPALAAGGGSRFRISAPATQLPDGFEMSDLGLGHEEEADARHLSASTATRWQMWPARVESGRFVADMPALAGHRVQFGVSR
jgi:hypothetical protein